MVATPRQKMSHGTTAAVESGAFCEAAADQDAAMVAT
jgi:hypothetical protein